MSNFKCPHCGMINIDCGKDGYKTPEEIKLEYRIEKLIEEIEAINPKDNTISRLFGKSFEEIRGIIESEEQLKYKLKIAVEALKTIEKEYPDVPNGLNIRARCALIEMGEIEMENK